MNGVKNRMSAGNGAHIDWETDTNVYQYLSGSQWQTCTKGFYQMHNSSNDTFNLVKVRIRPDLLE